MLDAAFVYSSNSIYAIWKNRIFSEMKNPELFLHLREKFSVAEVVIKT